MMDRFGGVVASVRCLVGRVAGWLATSHWTWTHYHRQNIRHHPGQSVMWTRKSVPTSLLHPSTMRWQSHAWAKSTRILRVLSACSIDLLSNSNKTNLFPFSPFQNGIQHATNWWTSTGPRVSSYRSLPGLQQAGIQLNLNNNTFPLVSVPGALANHCCRKQQHRRHQWKLNDWRVYTRRMNDSYRAYRVAFTKLYSRSSIATWTEWAFPRETIMPTKWVDYYSMVRVAPWFE